VSYTVIVKIENQPFNLQIEQIERIERVEQAERGNTLNASKRV
jgi:hypothetical protein